MPRTKAVIRNLPPDLPETSFREAVDAAGFAGRYGWFDYVPGKVKPKLVIPSVAYVALADEPALVAFGAAFNGRGFTHVPPTPPDGEDAPAAPVEPPKEYRATVEYAPWQKTPRARPRRDRREGTLERDPEYLAFLAELEAGPKVAVSAETLLDRRESERAAEARVNGGRAPVKMSALLKYLAAKRAKKRRTSSHAKVIGGEVVTGVTKSKSKRPNQPVPKASKGKDGAKSGKRTSDKSAANIAEGGKGGGKGAKGPKAGKQTQAKSSAPAPGAKELKGGAEVREKAVPTPAPAKPPSKIISRSKSVAPNSARASSSAPASAPAPRAAPRPKGGVVEVFVSAKAENGGRGSGSGRGGGRGGGGRGSRPKPKPKPRGDA